MSPGTKLRVSSAEHNSVERADIDVKKHTKSHFLFNCAVKQVTRFAPVRLLRTQAVSLASAGCVCR